MVLTNSILKEVDEKESFNENKKELMQGLNQLTERQKEILYLHYVNEMEYEEICEIMGMNDQSVRNLIQRSINKLREVYMKTGSL